jgi:ATP adenylyltransferase
MADFNKNLWAPWRMEYIRSLMDEEDEGCFLCRYWRHPESDAVNHVLWRTQSTLVVMNRFPYTTGHVLIAHGHHKGGITDLSLEELTDISRGIRDAVGVLEQALSPQGFNIGYNIGQCAGAGLPDHLHAHIVPRWSGDTNYMPVIGDVRVMPESLEAVHAQLVKAADAAGLRR